MKPCGHNYSCKTIQQALYFNSEQCCSLQGLCNYVTDSPCWRTLMTTTHGFVQQYTERAAQCDLWYTRFVHIHRASASSVVYYEVTCYSNMASGSITTSYEQPLQHYYSKCRIQYGIYRYTYSFYCRKQFKICAISCVMLYFTVLQSLEGYPLLDTKRAVLTYTNHLLASL